MIRFDVHVHPGSKVARVGGLYSGALVVRVRERAVDGAANEAVREALAAAFGVPTRHVECLRGRRHRHKHFGIEGDEAVLSDTLHLLRSQVN